LPLHLWSRLCFIVWVISCFHIAWFWFVYFTSCSHRFQPLWSPTPVSHPPSSQQSVAPLCLCQFVSLSLVWVSVPAFVFSASNRWPETPENCSSDCKWPQRIEFLKTWGGRVASTWSPKQTHARPRQHDCGSCFNKTLRRQRGAVNEKLVRGTVRTPHDGQLLSSPSRPFFHVLLDSKADRFLTPCVSLCSNEHSERHFFMAGGLWRPRWSGTCPGLN